MSSKRPDSKRRIWIRRPGQVPTTVLVSETDIVDDLKALVLMRYPTTLGRSFDPADITIKYIDSHLHYSESSSGGGHDGTNSPTTTKHSPQVHSHAHAGNKMLNAFKKHSHSNSHSHSQSNSHSHGPGTITSTNTSTTAKHGGPVLSPNPPRTPVESSSAASITSVDSLESSPAPFTEYILQPDELVFNIYNHFFPNGMTMADAFIIETPAQIAEYALTSPPEMAAGNAHPANMKPLSMESMPSYESGAMATSVEATVQPGPGAGSTVTIAEAPKPVRTSSNSTTSSSFSGSTKSSNNGVLLLPRHFQLQPSSKSEEKGTIPSTGADTTPTASSSSAKEKSVDDNAAANVSNGPESSVMLSPSSADHRSGGAYSQGNSSLQSPASPQGVVPHNNNNSDFSQKSKPLRRATNSGLSLREGVVPQVHVLIVEDNVINQRILETSMRRRRIRCQVAKDGKEAVEKWRQGGFHLVLMDIQLPVMSGTDAAKEIRRLEHINGIGAFSSEERQAIKTAKVADEDKLDTRLFKSPVIIVALTASSTSAAKSEALAAGCNDFVTKPVGLKWLEQKTIEWGCMQALIDYEGWKNWHPREDSHKDHGQHRGSFTRKNSSKNHRSSLGDALNRRSRSRSKSRHRHAPSGESSPNSNGPNPNPNPPLKPLTKLASAAHDSDTPQPRSEHSEHSEKEASSSRNSPEPSNNSSAASVTLLVSGS